MLNTTRAVRRATSVAIWFFLLRVFVPSCCSFSNRLPRHLNLPLSRLPFAQLSVFRQVGKIKGDGIDLLSLEVVAPLLTIDPSQLQTRPAAAISTYDNDRHPLLRVQCCDTGGSYDTVDDFEKAITHLGTGNFMRIRAFWWRTVSVLLGIVALFLFTIRGCDLLLGNVPIRFYGCVVDENGEPVTAATVSANVVSERGLPFIMYSGSSEDLKVTAVTDALGRFTLSGRGQWLDMGPILKQGYDPPWEHGEKFEDTFNYAPGRGQPIFMPDRDQPIIYRVHRAGSKSASKAASNTTPQFRSTSPAQRR